MQIGFLQKQQAELLNAILGYLASSYAICVFPLGGLFQEYFLNEKGKHFCNRQPPKPEKTEELCCHYVVRSHQVADW